MTSEAPLDPFQNLEREHRVIERVLVALEAATPETSDEAFFRTVVDFVRVFADGVHHDKEERHLFPALVRAGVHEEMGPVGVMLEEHEQGRRHIEQMEALILGGDVAGLCTEGRAYAALMRDHILKEDEVLFMMGRSVLPPDVVQMLEGVFASMPDVDATREKHQRIANELCARVGAPQATNS